MITTIWKSWTESLSSISFKRLTRRRGIISISSKYICHDQHPLAGLSAVGGQFNDVSRLPYNISICTFFGYFKAVFEVNNQGIHKSSFFKYCSGFEIFTQVCLKLSIKFVPCLKWVREHYVNWEWSYIDRVRLNHQTLKTL